VTLRRSTESHIQYDFGARSLGKVPGKVPNFARMSRLEALLTNAYYQH
jgi:hypothetical protein